MTNPFLDAIKDEQSRIQRLAGISTASDVRSRGHLRLQTRGNCTYAYERWQKKGQKERNEYLGTPDSEAVQELFSVHFQAKRQARLRHNQKLLKTLWQQYQPYDFDSVVSDMGRDYRKVARNNSFDARYEELKDWANAPYTKNPFPFPKAKIYAKDGTRLRSKGECIWYNLLQERGILFRNDCEVRIIDKQGNHKTLFPDFLIQCFDGTFIIIEHLGGMGELRYALDFGERSYWYFQDNFILGKNYFVTSDDPDFGTDSAMIAKLVDRIERMFYGY